MQNTITIQDKINKIPPDLIGDLELYLDFLIEKNKSKKSGKLKQNWAGALKSYSKKFKSLELQKKALDWRND